MSKNKNWQCSHCSRSCSRRWNLVVHIRRKHGGVGQPIDKENSSGSRNTSSSKLNGTHIDRRPSPTYNLNRSSINYSNQASKDKGDMIDEMHEMLTGMEKKRRKLEEIIEIVRKSQPFPIQTPYTDSSVISLKDMAFGPPNTPCHVKPHPESSIQPYITPNEITSQKTRREISSQDTLTSHKGENRSPSIQGDVSRPANVTWVYKLDMFGNVVDVYRVIRDPIEELRDFVKQCDKSNMFYQ